MKIAYNSSAVLANNALTRNDNRLAASLERLSSGLKIVNPKDNPSGLAMAKRMNAQLKGVSVATQNASDGVSVIEIADGALSEVHDILQRINELAVKSSTQTLTDDDREQIDIEVKALKEEITRIAKTTEFNSQAILDGSFDLKGYTSNIDVKVAYYGDEVKKGTYAADIAVAYDANGEITLAGTSVVFQADANIPTDAKVTSVNGNILTVTGSNNFEMKFEIMKEATSQTVTFASTKIELTGFGAMDMQIGSNEGQQLPIRIPKISLQNMGIDSIDLTTAESSEDALGRMSGALSYISNARSRLGAYQNRLEHTINNLDVISENMTASYSRIMDVDMAEEMTEYTTLQVMVQASTSMLAQANERPSQVLQLLQ